jgi:multidrug/hemolysin transport system permease protein
VFFSLLSIFIVIALYILFLRDVWVSSWADTVPDIAYYGQLALFGLTRHRFGDGDDGRFGIMIDDRVKRIDKDCMLLRSKEALCCRVIW